MRKFCAVRLLALGAGCQFSEWWGNFMLCLFVWRDLEDKYMRWVGCAYSSVILVDIMMYINIPQNRINLVMFVRYF